MQKLVVSSSPHLHDSTHTTTGIMLDVIIAMVPSLMASCWFFGLRSLILTAVGVLSAVFAEWYYQMHTKQKSTVGDLSAVVTGMLVAFNVPASAPWYVPLLGSFLAIILVKQIFGGLGQNFMNPALAARTILMLSWTSLMAATAIPQAGNLLAGLSGAAVDTVSMPTPLAMGVAGFQPYSILDLFVGNVPGMLGETSKMALLLGGLYLIIRRVIDWRIPVCFIGTVFVLYWIKEGVIYSPESGANNALYQILSGGLFLGAFFMATDYVTSPVTKVGKIIMGVGCGFMLFLVRVGIGQNLELFVKGAYNNSYPEGCSFAILFMNAMTPLIDKLTAPRTFGAVKPPKAKKGKPAAENAVKEGV